MSIMRHMKREVLRNKLKAAGFRHVNKNLHWYWEHRKNLGGLTK